jgi:thiamine-monophosphate kinase
MLIAGRHFHRDADPESIGHKALAVNLSDLAAMGAQARAFSLSIALDTQQDEAWLEAFSRGLFSLANSHACELIGGDTTAGPLCLSFTVIGEVPFELALRRDAAQPGDQVWVSGELGGAAFALKYPGQCVQAEERLHWPEPRLELGMALRGISACAMDLSDGLLGDICHILERSRVGVVLFADQIPLHPALVSCSESERLSLALQGGDDYELLFTARAQARPQIEGLADRFGLSLRCIGEITADNRRQLLDARGLALDMAFQGYEHFAS